MKWGVRKKDLKASIRKAQVDKSRADAFKTHGGTEDTYKGPAKKGGLLYKLATNSLGDIYTDQSTGKAYDRTVKKMLADSDIETIKKRIREQDKIEKSIDKYDDSHDPHNDNYDYRKVDAMIKQWSKAQQRAKEAVSALSRKYKDKFDDARLDDSGYAKVDKGREMIRSYNLDVPLSEIEKLIRNNVD
jgi:hypothetical protein